MSKKPLKGKELASYIRTHKEEFQNDGDAICIATGYGKQLKDGNQKCNFKPFIKELGKAIDLEDCIDEEAENLI